ncbi:MAG: asparagine synthase [Blautia sp.]|nr:asparagine synthase [Blautia sp.]
MVDKKYCMSSYLALRYIEKEGVEFREDFHHELIKPLPENEKIQVTTASDIDHEISNMFDSLKGQRLGLLLSGGMDSACLASYMSGCDAYTFRFLGRSFRQEEQERASQYAKKYRLQLHYVDIDWDTVTNYLEPVMRSKCAPVHSIEPQLLQAALQAKGDGIERLIVGESSDLVFGGMDGLLAKDWTVEEFQNRYTFLKPEEILVDSEDISYLFERYRKENNSIDFLKFMDEVFSIESSSSYMNAFRVAEMPYTDPYAFLQMADELDLNRVRNGEPKYLIRELFAMKYPELPIPEKIPMPRPVDQYFKEWGGPRRPEFRRDIDMKRYTGNQKWQMYCLESFLNMMEKQA